MPLVLIALLVAVPLAAQNVPLRDWSVPSSGGKLQKQANTAGNIVGFVKVTPCRIVDTRNAAGPFGGPALTAGGTRTFTIPAGPCTGIPIASSYSLLLTIVNYDAGGGFIVAYPSGTPKPGASTVTFGPNPAYAVANSAIVPANTSGAIDVFSSGNTHLIIDINGYYTDTADPNYQMQIVASAPGFAAIVGYNTSSTTGSHGVGGFDGAAGVVYGVQGQVGSATLGGSSGVHGINDSSAVGAYGVLGEITPTAAGLNSAAIRGFNHGTGGGGMGGWFSHGGTGWGVYSSVAGAGIAVNAQSNGGTGIQVVETTGTPIFALQNAAAGASASAIIASTTSQTANNTYGVTGQTGSTHAMSAGVRGIDASGLPGFVTAASGFFNGGVYGMSKTGSGVVGFSEYCGAAGIRQAADGTGDAEGFLGLNFGGTVYAVYAQGNLTATGVKNFIEPHPTDPNQVIRYVALEGPESGTYFRGRGKFVNHHAVIEVPDNFRMVTDADGLTVNITPMGGIASVGVISVDLNRVEVESTKDVEFSYLVQGVRKAFKDWQPISQGQEFAPRGPEDKMPGYLTAEAKRRLIANGTYNADGTVNMSTAERLGWAQQWRDREAEQAKISAEYAKQQALEVAQRTSQQQQ